MAYAWLSIAASSGIPRDTTMLQQLAKNMDSDQIDIARNIARGMIPGSTRASKSEATANSPGG